MTQLQTDDADGYSRTKDLFATRRRAEAAESALAEAQSRIAGYVKLADAAITQRDTLLTGLEALAGRFDKRDQWMRTMSAPNIGLAEAFKDAADDIRRTLASAGLEGKGNG